MIPYYLQQAADLSRTGNPKRKSMLGAIGIRNDGAIVTCVNGGQPGSRTPTMHAESRLTRKLDRDSVVYVSRTLKDSTIALAKPCKGCILRMRAKGVRRVTYTIGPDEWGVIEL